MKFIHALLLATALLSLGGCAATNIAIAKKNLDVQTKMSESVFLTPTADKTIYVEVRNSSDKADFTFGPRLNAMLESRGYHIEADPDKAHFQLQVNVLSVGSGAVTASQAASSGFGSPLDGFIASAATAAALNGSISGRGLGTVGLVGGAADFISAALVKDVTFHAITDVQISERAKGEVRVSGQQNLSQGTSGGERVSYEETTNWKRYRTRIASTANKVNLKWEEAQGALISGLTQSIGGVF